jgi:hypothetical protein
MGGKKMEKIEGEKMSSEQKQNRFILGAIVGGLAVYLFTNGNLSVTIFGAIIAGLLVIAVWK